MLRSSLGMGNESSTPAGSVRPMPDPVSNAPARRESHGGSDNWMDGADGHLRAGIDSVRTLALATVPTGSAQRNSSCYLLCRQSTA